MGSQAAPPNQWLTLHMSVAEVHLTCPWWAGLGLPAVAWVAVHLSYHQSPVSSFQFKVRDEWPAMQSLTYECSAAITCWCSTHRKYPVIGIKLQTNYLGPR